MNVFGKLFKARDKPRNSLNGSGYSFLFGNTVAGKTVNERSAMQMSAVYACVRILSEAIAALPLHFYQYNAAGGKEKALRHPLYNLLHDEPNPEMTAFSFRETLMTHLLLWGKPVTETYATKEGTSITRQTGEVEWTAIKRTSDGRYQAVADEGENGFTAEKAAAFLNTVYTPVFTAVGS